MTSTYSCKPNRKPSPRWELLEQHRCISETQCRKTSAHCMIPRTKETNPGNRNQKSGRPRFGGQRLWKRDTRHLPEEKETLYLDLGGGLHECLQLSKNSLTHIIMQIFDFCKICLNFKNLKKKWKDLEFEGVTCYSLQIPVMLAFFPFPRCTVLFLTCQHACMLSPLPETLLPFYQHITAPFHPDTHTCTRTSAFL